VIILQVVQGPDRGMRFELPDKEPQLIGRSSESLPITDNTVSRRHAELTPDDGSWYLRDLESSNGTFINGQRITAERVRLSPGDQVRCGQTLFIFTTSVDEARRSSAVELMGGDAIDVTVESTSDPNAESMILAAPDPVRAAADHLRIIYELTALTASTIQREEMLDKVMDLIFREFRPDRGFVLLGEDPSAPLDAIVVRYRVRPKSIDEGHIPVSRTIIQHTIGKGEGVLSTNAMNDTRFRSGDSVREYGIRSAICVPITAGTRVLGIIHIDSQMANFTFTEAQLQLMNAIGRHCGLAVRSTELVRSTVQTERLAAIGQTVASISHSVKNILQGLRGGADAVELALNRDDLKLAKEGWPILVRNLDRIFTLTLNMLAYSRQSSLDLELADLHALINEVADLINPQCEHKQVGLLLDFAEDMPPIPIDVNGIHQVITNVLMNAVEAAPHRRGIVTIATEFAPHAHEARIRVSDNGAGIDYLNLEDAFEAFSSTKGQRGTGLGLAVAKKIIEEHHGRIELQTQPGRGTTVRFALPSDEQTMDAGDTRLPRPLPGDELPDAF